MIVNGLPKSGTHAVMAWFARMGMKRRPGTLLDGPAGLRAEGATLDSLLREQAGTFAHAHVPATRELPGMVVTVFRDPRNVLVSYCRHRERDEGVRPTIGEALADFWGVPFIPLYDAYLGWHGRSIVLRYEDLPAEQTGDGAGLYTGKDWNTRTGAPSNWRKAWTPADYDAWYRAGGQSLLERAGYDERIAA